MSEKRAVVVGHRGQDGRLLCDLLRSRGYSVVGIGRDCVEPNGTSVSHTRCPITEPEAVERLVDSVHPDEIYYLAAHHRSSEADRPNPAVEWSLSYEVNATGALHFLEAIRKRVPTCRLFYASSSLIYGDKPLASPQTELTPYSPSDPYGATKALGGDICRDYRTRHGVFASIGILYNHESALRRNDFLSAKLIRAALSAYHGDSSTVRVGDLDARVDWGYAPDFVDAFTRILSVHDPDDFIVATGTTHTVREFAQAAFGCLNLDWSNFVRCDPSLLTRSSSCRVGNPAKLMQKTGWRPTMTFSQMVASISEATARVARPCGLSQ